MTATHHEKQAKWHWLKWVLLAVVAFGVFATLPFLFRTPFLQLRSEYRWWAATSAGPIVESHDVNELRGYVGDLLDQYVHVKFAIIDDYSQRHGPIYRFWEYTGGVMRWYEVVVKDGRIIAVVERPKELKMIAQPDTQPSR